MTPHEILIAVRGFNQRMLAYQAIAGWAAAVTLSAWSDGKIPRPPFSPDDQSDTVKDDGADR